MAAFGRPMFMRTRQLFWRFPFLRPLSFLLLIALVIFSLQLLRSSYEYANVNWAAARIRDDEEVRLAAVQTKLFEWKEAHGIPILRYESGSSHGREYTKLKQPTGITFAILAPNRRTGEIDSYQPSYLTESVATLIESTYHDLSTYGKRHLFINLTLCPTADRLTDFTELRDVSKLLGDQSVKPRMKSLDNLPILCRTVLDAGSCLIQSATATIPGGYVVLLEDDIIGDRLVLRRLWQLLGQLESTAIDDEHIGVVQLHIPHRSVRYQLSDLSSMLELLTVSSLMALILFLFWFRIWIRPLRLDYNLFFFICTVLVCSVFVCLIGRMFWWSLWHRFVSFQSLTPSPSPLAPSLGAAVLLPSKLAQELGSFLFNGVRCDRSPPNTSSFTKAEIIYRFLSEHNQPIWTTFPGLFKHRGLYSIYKKDIIHPYFVE